MGRCDRWGRLTAPRAAVFLDPGDTQAGQAVGLQQPFPRAELVDRQPVAAARLFERNQAAVHAGDDLGLAADHPPSSAGRRKVVDGHRDAAGAQRFVAGAEPLALQMAALGAAGRACLVFCHRFVWSF